jgi:hypothetical protein
MPFSQFLLPIDAYVQIISAVLALTIWYYSYRAYRFLGVVTLLFLSTSFLLFAAGLLGQAAYTLDAFSQAQSSRYLFIGEGYLIYSVLELSGYLVLSVAYSANIKAEGFSLSVLGSLRRLLSFRRVFGYGVQIISTILIIYVLSRIYVEYKSKKLSYSKLVGLGFGMMLVQHIIRLVLILNDPAYLFSSLFQLAGFVMIFYAVWKVNTK